MTGDLRELQRLLYKLITAPDGVRRALQAEGGSLPAGGVGAVIVGDERLGPVERLRIYADAYFYRLLECLKDDFHGVAGVLGADRFQELIRGYLAAYPPVHSSITYAGRSLAEFISRSGLLKQWSFLAELARLEWALIEVFQAPDAVILSAQELRAIAPERWPAMRLRTPPALRILDCQWPVAGVLRAISEGKDWETPKLAPQAVMVWRLDGLTYYREIAGAEQSALSLLARGASFTAVCEAVAATCGHEDAPREITRFLERWLSDGCLMLETRKSPGRARPTAKHRPSRPVD